MKYVALAFLAALCFSALLFADEVILISVQDVELDEEDPDLNEGDKSDFQIGATWDAEPNFQVKGLIKFPVELTEVIVDEAVLQLHVIGNKVDMEPGPIDIFRATEPWDELAVTWNTKPGENREIVVTGNAPMGTPGNPALWELDVTAIVQSWVDGFANNGLYIDVPDNNNSVDVDIVTKDHFDTLLYPRLYVNFHQVDALEEIPSLGIGLNVTRTSYGLGEISYNLPFDITSSLSVYNALGSLVKTIDAQPGSHSVIFNDIPGIYFVRFETPSTVLTKKLVLTR